jgi:glycolate oxidase iron-sulfur subunit
LPDRFFAAGRVIPAVGEKRGQVALLSGCVMGTVYADTNAATVRVLKRNGFQVVIPKDQSCCGALAIHAGERTTAKEQARRNIDAFNLDGQGGEGEGYDAILVNASGCGVALKEYQDLLRDDPVYAHKAQQLSAKIQDVTEFLAARGIQKPGREIHARVTYQDPCHLAHGQNVRAQPRALLKMIPGLQLVELRDSDRCCGSAGIYNLTHPELSRQLLDEKMENVKSAEPELIVTANAGCLMQLQLGVRRAGLKAEVLHIIDLLDRAYD